MKHLQYNVVWSICNIYRKKVFWTQHVSKNTSTYATSIFETIETYICNIGRSACAGRWGGRRQWAAAPWAPLASSTIKRLAISFVFNKLVKCPLLRVKHMKNHMNHKHKESTKFTIESDRLNIYRCRKGILDENCLCCKYLQLLWIMS